MSAVTTDGFRADIQGLRAVAVLLVLLFHIWPAALPGGYVGVDVFFVISGFLITSLLRKELEQRGTISLSRFYARRMLRLLPAASVTLVAVGVAASIWLPKTLWGDLWPQLLASGFYVENLLLVQRSVDYLALEADASAVQHYWSLSIEEQFYIFWPIMMLFGARIARSAGVSTGHALLLLLGSMCLLSLCWAIYISYVDPAPGYFMTSTRVWELGVGGLLALLNLKPIRSPLITSAVGWGGFLAIVLAGCAYNITLPFPGYEALLPTLGAAAILYANLAQSSFLGGLLGSRMMQYVGGISYSLYLWHWPVVVFYPHVSGSGALQLSDGFIVLAVSAVAAHISKTQIEDRFRHGTKQPGRANEGNVYLIGAACAVGVVFIAGGLWYRTDARAPSPAFELSADYPGAEALGSGVPVPEVPSYRPTAANAKLDRGSAYADETSKSCIVDAVGTELLTCDRGQAQGQFHVVLIGDSHAAHWIPAFEQAAIAEGWRFTGLSKDSCLFSDLLVDYGRRNNPVRKYVECREWSQNAFNWIVREQPDLVVISQSPNHRIDGLPPPESQSKLGLGIADIARRLSEAGVAVAAIKHTPWLRANVPTCMETPEGTVQSCSSSRSSAIREGAISIAARVNPEVGLLDFEKNFCTESICPAVVGNVLVYRDEHHMTATFSQTLAPALTRKLRAYQTESAARSSTK